MRPARPLASAGLAVVAAVLVGLAAPGAAGAQPVPSRPVALAIDAPELVLAGIPFAVEVRAVDEEGRLVESFEGEARLAGIRTEAPLRFVGGRLALADAVVASSGRRVLRVVTSELVAEVELRAIPGILSILPPVFAIVLALAFRQVLVSLFAGIWLGALFLYDYNPVAGFYAVLDRFLVDALTERSQAQIVVFSMLFGGMVGVITRNGGARGIAGLITRYARTPRGVQIAAWATALVLFFDDYANALVRGNLMRPITDRLRVSREKLSFIVDAGAASVPSIFLVSTWIGYEVGLIDGALRIIDSDLNAYSVFVDTIPYRFYPIFIMIFTLLVGWSGRDFGPMLEAERRARRSGKVLRDGAQPATEVLDETTSTGKVLPPRWYNGLLPIVAVLLVAFFGIFWTGMTALEDEGVVDYGLREILGASDSYVALLWASLTGCLVAMGLALAERIMTLTEAIDAWFQGLKAMLMAIVILLLAWSIGSLTEELHTADYVVQILRGVLSPYWLPVLTFAISATIAFATGTSWATMAIIMPLVIPLAHRLALDAGLGPERAYTILVGVVSSVLAGAVFGDHCSPISDTTILSSMSSSCDHIDHVRTQLPYALVAAFVGMLVGDIPTAFGLPAWVSLATGVVVLAGVVYGLGSPVEEPAGEEGGAT